MIITGGAERIKVSASFIEESENRPSENRFPFSSVIFAPSDPLKRFRAAWRSSWRVFLAFRKSDSITDWHIETFVDPASF